MARETTKDKRTRHRKLISTIVLTIIVVGLAMVAMLVSQDTKDVEILKAVYNSLLWVYGIFVGANVAGHISGDIKEVKMNGVTGSISNVVDSVKKVIKSDDKPK